MDNQELLKQQKDFLQHVDVFVPQSHLWTIDGNYYQGDDGENSRLLWFWRVILIDFKKIKQANKITPNYILSTHFKTLITVDDEEHFSKMIVDNNLVTMGLQEQRWTIFVKQFIKLFNYYNSINQQQDIHISLLEHKDFRTQLWHLANSQNCFNDKLFLGLLKHLCFDEAKKGKYCLDLSLTYDNLKLYFEQKNNDSQICYLISLLMLLDNKKHTQDNVYIFDLFKKMKQLTKKFAETEKLSCKIDKENFYCLTLNWKY